MAIFNCYVSSPEGKPLHFSNFSTHPLCHSAEEGIEIRERHDEGGFGVGVPEGGGAERWLVRIKLGGVSTNPWLIYG